MSAILLISALVPGLAIVQDAEAPRPPVVGRPDYFDEDESPIGTFQTPAVHAEPQELQAEDPLTLTVRITAPGPVQRAPRPPKLEEFPGFKEQFYIAPAGDAAGHQVAEQTWEFTYTLRPKSPDVKSIPSFPFVYFTPGFLPPQRGYQVRRTAEVPLTVRPRSVVRPEEVQGALPTSEAPEAVWQLVEGAPVLERPAAWTPGQLLALGTPGLLLPPAACLAWFITWRRLYPDAARQARQRRSRAARLALKALQSAGREDDPARRTAAVVADYLRQRHDLPMTEPTPAEVGACLRQMGCPSELVAEAGEFFRTCDAARFAGEAALPAEKVTEAAARLILDLEAASCPAPVS